MEQVIDGKRYNTETATLVCELPCDYYQSDFKWHDTKLYKTRNGRYFLAGEGGPMSMWSRTVGNSYIGGCGIKVISVKEARDYAELSKLSFSEMKKIGFEVEEG